MSKTDYIAKMLAAVGDIKRDIKVLVAELALDKAVVRAFAIDSGTTQYFARMAMQNVTEDRIHLQDGLKDFSVEFLVHRRGRGRRENITIPMEAIANPKARAKWIAKYVSEMDAYVNKDHIWGEVRARQHNRCMSRLPKAQRQQIIQAADKIQSK